MRPGELTFIAKMLRKRHAHLNVGTLLDRYSEILRDCMSTHLLDEKDIGDTVIEALETIVQRAF